MNDRQHDRSNKHKRSSFTNAVIKSSENRSQQNRTERQHGRNKSCHFGFYMIFGNHQLRGEFQEREHPGIEHQAQQGNQPKAFVGKNQFQIFQLETFFLFLADRFDRLVEFLIHDTIYQVCHQTYTQAKRTE